MQNLSKYLLVIALITTINGYVATRFMKANKEEMHFSQAFIVVTSTNIVPRRN